MIAFPQVDLLSALPLIDPEPATACAQKATAGIHGTFLSRLRPGGKYHFERNFYDHENYDYKFFDLNYWTQQSRDPKRGPYFGQNPDSLLAAWRTSITPNVRITTINSRRIIS